MSVKIYVEGGGNIDRTLRACRIGFGRYFEQIARDRRKPRVIACGDAASAFRDFCKGIGDSQYDAVLLLVDSEEPLAPQHTTWQHLTAIAQWRKPAGAADDSAYLMVQCMEAWFLADREVLKQFYGNNFNETALPGQRQVELIRKADVLSSLKNASRRSSKGPYHKTKHGFEILARLRPTSVAAGSAEARRLNDFLSR